MSVFSIAFLRHYNLIHHYQTMAGENRFVTMPDWLVQVWQIAPLSALCTAALQVIP